MKFGDMNKMMKQVQKMQQEMERLQQELVEKTVEATAGGGMVRVVCNGRHQLTSIEINPEAVDPDDVEMLQDVVMAAVNEALRKSQEMVDGEMERITGGLGLPGLPRA